PLPPSCGPQRTALPRRPLSPRIRAGSLTPARPNGVPPPGVAPVRARRRPVHAPATPDCTVENQYFTYVKEYILTFTSILYEAMPFIVLGAIIAGILEEFVPQRLIVRILPRSRTLGIGLGGLLGLIFPMCECGIIPIMRRLIRKGVPLSCC